VVHQKNGLIRPLLATDGVGVVVSYQRMNCREFVLLCNGVQPSVLAQFEIQDLAAVADSERELIVGGRGSKKEPAVLCEVRLHDRLQLILVTEVV
jgi:hypothetical protein